MEQSTSSVVSNLSTYRWEIPGKPVSIHLRLDVIDRMSPEILRGLGALKRRGAEVGGLLLGRCEPGSPQQIWIEDFDPVPSEYLSGPSYRLSEKDRAALESAIAKRQSHPEAKLSVVGFYRSHTRDELFMDDDDLALARRYFSDPANVFLIVKPFMMRPSIGGFFIWEDGAIFKQSSYQQFPFSRRELGGGDSQPPRAARPDRPASPPTPPPAAVAPPVVAPTPPRAADPPPSQPSAEVPMSLGESPAAGRQYSGLSILADPDEPDYTSADEPESGSSVGRWLLVLVLVCLVGVGGYFGYQKFGVSAAKEPDPVTESITLPLKLSVEEKEDHLDVTWDRSGRAVATATRGLLFISDGTTTRSLELTGDQLRSGRILYSKLSGDVTLRLEVFPEGQGAVTESIRILSSDPSIRTKPPVTNSPPPPTPPVVAPETIAAPPKKATPAPRAERRAPTRSAPVSRRKEEPKAVEPTPEAPPPQPEIELQRPERRR